MSYIDGKGVTNFSGVRSKSGRYYFASGAQNASLFIDSPSSDFSVGIDDQEGTVAVKGGTVTNWGTVSITPGAMLSNSGASAGAQVTGLKTTDKVFALIGNSANESLELGVSFAYCQPDNSLIVGFINTTGAVTHGAKTITWIRLV